MTQKILHKRTAGSTLPTLDFGELAIVAGLERVYAGKPDGSLIDVTANQPITLSGDLVGSGKDAIATSLSLTGIAAGEYPVLTVDEKGRAVVLKK